MTYTTQLTGRRPMPIPQFMMMLLAAFVLVILQSSTVQAQWTTNGTNINNTNTGNVGIGTTTPAGQLTVATSGSGANTLALFDSANDAPTTFPNLVFQRSRGTQTSRTAVLSGDRLGGFAFRGYGATNFLQTSDNAVIRAFAAENFSDTAMGTYLTFETTPTGTVSRSEKLRIMANGNVGVGTTSPIEVFHVRRDQNAGTHLVAENATAGASAITDVLIKNDLGNFAQFGLYSSLTTPAGAIASGNAYAYTTSPGMAIMANNASGIIKFATGGVSERMRIDASGNVGIGTISPGYRLDVQGGALNSSGGLCIAGDCKTAWSQVGGSQWTTSGSNLYYNSGNVGIGTTNPGAKLAVTANTQTSASFSVTPDGTNNYYAGNTHDALVVDGSSTGTHGTYGGGNVRLFRIRALTGADSLVVGRGGDIVVTPNTNYAAAALKLSPDGTNSYYAGVDYDVLQIVGTGLSTHGTYTGKTVRLIHVTNATGSDAFVIARDGNATFGGNVTVTGNINAKYQDVAEWVQSSQELSAGTVVVLDHTKSNQVIASSISYDTRVAGVISLQPGITLGENGAGKVLVATTGRVRIKADATSAPIQIGDLLVTSDQAGMAMKSQSVNVGGVHIHRPGTIIGKALEPLANGRGEILVLLSLQ